MDTIFDKIEKVAKLADQSSYLNFYFVLSKYGNYQLHIAVNDNKIDGINGKVLKQPLKNVICSSIFCKLEETLYLLKDVVLMVEVELECKAEVEYAIELERIKQLKKEREKQKEENRKKITEERANRKKEKEKIEKEKRRVKEEKRRAKEEKRRGNVKLGRKKRDRIG